MRRQKAPALCSDVVCRVAVQSTYMDDGWLCVKKGDKNEGGTVEGGG